MLLKSILVVLAFCVSTTSAALAEVPSWCPPPGSNALRWGDCLPQQTPKPKLVPTYLVLSAVACDVGHAAMAAQGKKFDILTIPFTVTITFKEVATTTDSGGVGISGILPWGGVKFGGSTTPTQVLALTSIQTFTHAPLPAPELIAQKCGGAGYRSGTRTAAYRKWLTEFTSAVSAYRQGALGKLGTIKYGHSFAATNSLKNGFNITFILALNGSSETSDATTQEIEILSGKPAQ